jgi:hypothetical protein
MVRDRARNAKVEARAGIIEFRFSGRARRLTSLDALTQVLGVQAPLSNPFGAGK